MKIFNYRTFWMFVVVAAFATLPVFAKTEKPRLIMVGDNWCPYNCAPDANRRGYMVDILERVLSPHFELTYRLEPWTRAIKLVETNEAQLLIATPSTTANKIVTSVPLGVDRSCFFVRKDNPWRYKQISDLVSVRLGVVQDYSYDDNGPLDTLISQYRERKDPKLESAFGANAMQTNFLKLKGGRMDVLIENENVGNYIIQESKMQNSIGIANCITHHVSTTHVAVASKRSDAKAIVMLINSGLRELRRTGELKNILKPYGMSDWQSVKTSNPVH
jgi:polar amino acid transport system substrate-binding protein